MKKFYIAFLDFLSSGLLAGFFEFISLFDEKRAIGFCVKLIHLFTFLVPRFKRATKKNISLVFPDLSAEEQSKIIRKSYAILAENIYWFSRIRKLTVEELKPLFDYREAQPVYESLIKSDLGFLIITPHFGFFELLAQGHAVWGRPFAALARGSKLPRVNALWKSARERFGLKIFDRKGGFKEIIKYINQGTDVAVLYDQNVTRNHAAFVDFFGVPAATTKSVALVPIRTNCKSVFCACVENPPEERKYGRFKIYVRELINPNIDPELKDLSNDEKVHGFLLKTNKELEKLIRLYPEYWFWIHRRWKTRPEGETANFYD